MIKIILRYGTLTGIVMAALLFATTLLLEKIGYSNGELVITGSMVFSFMPIFLGVRKYRDTINGGNLEFGRAVSISMLTYLFANIFHVLAWLFIYYKMPEIVDKMLADTMVQIKASGMSQKEIGDYLERIKEAKTTYENPLINAANTYANMTRITGAIFFSLITGLILRKKPVSLPPSLLQ